MKKKTILELDRISQEEFKKKNTTGEPYVM